MKEVSDWKKGISPLGGGIVLAVLTALILAGVACFVESQGNQSPQVYENIGATKAKDLIVSEDPIVLDVRTPDEFEKGHIPGAILVPVDELKGSTFLKFPHDKEVLIYCRSGHRSFWAAEYLSRQGYVKSVQPVRRDPGLEGTWLRGRESPGEQAQVPLRRVRVMKKNVTAQGVQEAILSLKAPLD